jgi:predicted glycoside hydrolase/deacetylase ChbG (UPF0249 family)
MKYVLFNADDFGYSHGINRGIVEAHEKGVVTSTSLVVNGRAAREAADLAAGLPNLSLGLHVNFTNEAEHLFDLDDPGLCRTELERQYEAFLELVGRQPSHLDSHQHVHRHPVRIGLFRKLAEDQALHLRDDPPVVYKGGFYAQWEYGKGERGRVSFEALERILRNEIFEGIYEMCCHPGYVDAAFQSVYHEEREWELRTLCDSRVRRVLEEEDLSLIGYGDVAHVKATLEYAR